MIMHMIVMMVVMRMLMSGVAERQAQTVHEQAQADDDNYPAGDKTKYGEESFG